MNNLLQSSMNSTSLTMQNVMNEANHVPLNDSMSYVCEL